MTGAVYNILRITALDACTRLNATTGAERREQTRHRQRPDYHHTDRNPALRSRFSAPC